jgi:hypothetical protein
MLLDACLHALGHSLYSTFSEASLDRLEAACISGASAAADSRNTGGCLNGLYMSDRNARFSGENWENFDGGEAFDVSLKHCVTAAQPLSCAVLYSEPALSTAPGPLEDTFDEFHRWCTTFENQLREPWPACAYNLGWSATAVLHDAPAELSLCERLLAPATNLEHCLAGMLGGRQIAGMPEPRAREEICAVLTAGRCAAVRSLAELRSGSRGPIRP